MLRTIFCGVLCVLATASRAQEPPAPLLQPHYHRNASDPPWLERVVQLHGHLGPSVVAGARLALAGLRAVEAKGYFDVEVTCEGPFAKPPESCFLDGVQVATGATLGKRNLRCVEAEKTVLRIRNTRTGKTADVRLATKLAKLLEQAKVQGKGEHAEERVEQIARDIAAMPDAEILTISRP